MVKSYFPLPRWIDRYKKKEPPHPELTPNWVRIAGGPLGGRQMLLAPQANKWQSEMAAGKFESFLHDAISDRMSLQSKTVWDIGAHIGYHALTFASLAGEAGHVVAFEPNPYNAERFRQNAERNPDLLNRISLQECALSDHDCETNFFLSPQIDNGVSSESHLEEMVIYEKRPAYALMGMTTVSCVRVDTLLRDQRVHSPSVIKIDVEGAELSVLKGGLALLANTKPLLVIEIHNVIMMFHVQKLLANIGYDLEILDEENSLNWRCYIIAIPASHA